MNIFSDLWQSFHGIYEFLCNFGYFLHITDVARSLGVEKDGWIYATSNFANVCSDELVLHDGDRLKVLRRGDESETEWWWARDEKNAEGYVPQSLLAVSLQLLSYA